MTTPSSIAHYRITSKLGEGGMGAVYRATDTKLNRDVAIKVLPPAFAGDAARMQRFEREAQVLASLNHPNIAAIYGVEEGAIVMELVDGEDLKGPVPVETAISYAHQIAIALEAAHEKGIIHRDLKPANIKVTPEGTVKLLDFGLAKTGGETVAGVSADSPTMSPTLSLAMTEAGMVLGTAAYMSPEQARGKPVDKRADIWAFGVVLFEMLTGRRLFGGGETVSDSLAAIITKEPDWNALPKDTPLHIRRLLERCLRKDPKTRLQAIGEARIVMDEAHVAQVPDACSRRRSWLPWAVAGLALALAAAGWWRATRPAPLAPMMRLDFNMPPDTPLGRGATIELSPDGTLLAVTLRGADGKIRLYTRRLHQHQVTPLAGTEGANTPFFSPDGQWIGFAADGKLKKISVDGGTAVTLCDAPGVRGVSWGDDGNIIAALDPTGGLSRIPSAGGPPVPVSKLKEGERTHRWPQVLPGSHAVMFTSHTSAGGVYDDANIEVLLYKTGERKTVQRGGFSGRYLASGHLIYVHQNTLYAAPFDSGRLAVTAAPVSVLEDLYSTSNAGGVFSFSQTGTFVYLTGQGSQGGWPIFWLDSSGKTQPLQTPLGRYTGPRFSPDGKRLAFSLGSPAGADIWVKDLGRDTASRLSSLPGLNHSAVWTPDGKSIVFQSENPAAPGIYWIRSDGSGEPQRLTDGKLGERPCSFSPDGKRLAFWQFGTGGSPDIFTAAIEGDPAHPRLGKPALFLGTPSIEAAPAFSPDGRWLSYVSNESGTLEVYVRPFPGAGGRWQISNGGGVEPAWSRDGRELLFQSPDYHIMAVSYIAKGDSFAADKPRVRSEARLRSLGIFAGWDMAPDGKRFAVMLADAGSDDNKVSTQLTFLLNFFDELRRRARAGGK